VGKRLLKKHPKQRREDTRVGRGKRKKGKKYVKGEGAYGKGEDVGNSKQ